MHVVVFCTWFDCELKDRTLLNSRAGAVRRMMTSSVGQDDILRGIKNFDELDVQELHHLLFMRLFKGITKAQTLADLADMEAALARTPNSHRLLVSD